MSNPGAFTIEHSIEVRGDVVVFTIRGRLDAVRLKKVEAELVGLPDQGHRKVVLDLSQMDWMDSSGARILIALYKKLRGVEGTIGVANLQRQPKEIFRLLSLDSALEVFPSVDEAVAKVTQA